MIQKEALDIDTQALAHMISSELHNFKNNLTPEQIAKLKKGVRGTALGLGGLGAATMGIPIYKAIKGKKDSKLEKVPKEHQWSRLETGVADTLWEPYVKGTVGATGGALLGGAAGAAIGKAKGASSIGALMGAGLGGLTGLVGGMGSATGNIIADQIKGPEYVDPATMRGKAYGTVGGILGGPISPITTVIGYNYGKKSKLKEMGKEASDSMSNAELTLSKIAKAEILYPFKSKAEQEKEKGIKAMYDKMLHDPKFRSEVIDSATSGTLKKSKNKLIAGILGVGSLLGAGYAAKKHLQKESSLENVSDIKRLTKIASSKLNATRTANNLRHTMTESMGTADIDPIKVTHKVGNNMNKDDIKYLKTIKKNLLKQDKDHFKNVRTTLKNYPSSKGGFKRMDRIATKINDELSSNVANSKSLFKKNKIGKFVGGAAALLGLGGAGYLAKKHLQKESSLEKVAENKERTLKDYATTLGAGALLGGATGGIYGSTKDAVKKYHANRRQNYIWNLGDKMRYEDIELQKHKYDRAFYGDKKVRNIVRRRSTLQGALKGAGTSALLGAAISGADYAIKKYKKNKDNN